MAKELISGNKDASVLVIGLGRFGVSLASTVADMGRDVLAMEQDPEIVARWSSTFRVVEGDAKKREALEQIGATDFQAAVVGVGTTLEASVLITANLVDIKIPQIWAKAISVEHGRILRRIGAHHVVYPEYDAGRRVAHLVSGRMMDYIDISDDFTIVKMYPPQEVQGYTLGQARIRERFGVTVLGVQVKGMPFEYASPDTRIGPKDIIIVSGQSLLLEKFAHLP